jgi:5-methyltetrahydrofolate--homocysteine methyltransferase
LHKALQINPTLKKELTMNITETINQNVLEGNAQGVEASINQAIQEGLSPETILKQGLISAMDRVGKLYEEGEFFVPEMLIAARAMQAGMRILKPKLVAEGSKSNGRIAVGTVRGDLHDIGKNLVVMMFEGAGFEVKDLGVDVDPAAFVKAAQEGAQVLGMSALLTTTMSNMQTTVEALQTAGVRGQVKVIIGGAPVTEDYAKKIGVDGFAPDASSAVRVVRGMLA